VIQKKSTAEVVEFLQSNSHLKSACPSQFRVITDFHRDDEGDKAAANLITALRSQGWTSTPVLIYCSEKADTLDIVRTHPDVITGTSQTILHLYFASMRERSHQHCVLSSTEPSDVPEDTKETEMSSEDQTLQSSTLKHQKSTTYSDTDNKRTTSLCQTLPKTKDNEKRRETQQETQQTQTQMQTETHRTNQSNNNNNNNNNNKEKSYISKKSSHNGKEVKEPLQQTVRNKSDMARIEKVSVEYTTIEGSLNPTVGTLQTFTIRTRDCNNRPLASGQANVHVELKEKSGRSFIEGFVVDNEDGTYTVSYFPTRVGSYLLSVTVNGTELKGFPVAVVVKANPTSDALKRKLSESPRAEETTSSHADSKKSKKQKREIERRDPSQARLNTKNASKLKDQQAETGITQEEQQREIHPENELKITSMDAKDGGDSDNETYWLLKCDRRNSSNVSASLSASLSKPKLQNAIESEGEFQWGTTTEEYQKSDDRSRSLPRVDETEATLKIDYSEEEADDNDNGIEHSSPKKAHTTESDFEPTQILSTD